MRLHVSTRGAKRPIEARKEEEGGYTGDQGLEKCTNEFQGWVVALVYLLFLFHMSCKSQMNDMGTEIPHGNASRAAT